MNPARYVGADGCKGGRWACVWIDNSGRAGFEVVQHTRALWERFNRAERILLDVPIGLSNRPAWRECDLQAKRVLGRANSRVFLTPPRAVLECPDWTSANRLSRELSGHGVSKQTWMIAPRIREVDALLRSEPAARGIIRECHPEICAWGLSQGSPAGSAGIATHGAPPSKKTEEGAEFRLRLLEPLLPESRSIVDRATADLPRSLLGRDDVIDALLAAATAAAPAEGLRTLPERPELDGFGLPMEMVYRPA